MRNLPETVHEYNIPRLNVLFIFSSILLLLSVGWMLYDDYYREWKPYQRQAKQFELQKLQEDRKAALKKMEEGGYTDVTNQLAAAQIRYAQNRHQRAAYETQLRSTLSTIAIEKNTYASEKALLDQYKSEYDEAVEFDKGPSAINEKLLQLHRQENIVDEQNLKIQDLEKQRDSLQQDLSKFTDEKVQFEKEKANLAKERDLLDKRLREIQDKLSTALRDAPLIEFAKPTLSIRQIIAEDMTYSLIFAHVARIDRCNTCHTFVDKKDTLAEGEEGFRYTNLPLPWRSHPRLDLFLAPESPHPMERFGCSVCHLGWDRGTQFIHAAHTPSYHETKADYVKLPLVESLPYWVTVADVEKWRPGLLDKIKEHQKLSEEVQALKSKGLTSQDHYHKTKEARDQIRSEMNSLYGFSPEQLSQVQFASFTPFVGQK